MPEEAWRCILGDRLCETAFEGTHEEDGVRRACAERMGPVCWSFWAYPPPGTWQG